MARLGDILKETKTGCYAWALIPNHFHLLLRTGTVSISTIMRRLLTGHAIWYNRRHRRDGHLFQNRYKSILCQEENYLLELVRYIHLSPLRAGIVQNTKQLEGYQYCGHGVLMAKRKNDWQDTDQILGMFDDKASTAKYAYKAFVEKGITQGKRSDLTGGGFVRSAGGWAEVKVLKKATISRKSDERILGDGDFVERVLASANKAMERKFYLESHGFNLDKVAARVAEVLGMKQEDVWAMGKYRHIVNARSLLCFWAVREMGITMSSLARKLNISVPAISKSTIRGESWQRPGNIPWWVSLS